MNFKTAFPADSIPSLEQKGEAKRPGAVLSPYSVDYHHLLTLLLKSLEIVPSIQTS